MNTPCISSGSLFYKLFKTRLLILRHLIPGKALNFSIWSFCTLVIFGHVMQAFGLASDFGIFQIAGIVGTAGLFEAYGNAALTILDLSGDRSISYYLTLPARPWVILLSSACAYACVGTGLSLAMVFFGKLLLFNTFSLAAVSWLKLLPVLLLANLFYGILPFAIAGHIGFPSKIGNAWARFIFPMWFFGGFQFSWIAMNKALPVLSYATLANPVLYAMEGIRAAILGQEGHLPWLLCVGALAVASGICWLIAYNRMQKRLDFV